MLVLFVHFRASKKKMAFHNSYFLLYSEQLLCSVLNILPQLSTFASASLKLWMLSHSSPSVCNHWFFTARDGRCYLSLAAMLLCFTKRQPAVHPPSPFSPSVSHCFSRLCTGRQFVQKQAPCPPPQTQRWRNWAPSTLSSYSSTLNVSRDGEAGERGSVLSA